MSTKAPPAQIAIFAKYWEPGLVKTRLAVDLGGEAAAALAREFLATSLRRLTACSGRLELVYAPASHHRQFVELAGPAWRLQPQRDGDLGARLEDYVTAAQRDAPRRLVVLGSDSPTLPLGYVRLALELLRFYPVVLAPSEDGGYVLLGVRGGDLPPLFEDMPWSTPRLWAATVRCLQRHDTPWACLPPWYDIDNRADLLRLRGELTAGEDPGLEPLRDCLRRLPLRDTQPADRSPTARRSPK